MAQVPYSGVPTVADSGPGNLRENIQSSPADFGGLIGGAEQTLGRDLGQAGAEVGRTAVEIQGLHNQIVTQDAYNKLQQSYIDLTYGDPKDPTKPGFYALKGREAQEAYPTVRQALDDSRSSILGGLQNDAQRLAFETDSRRLQYYTQTTIGRHADEQQNVYGSGVAKSQSDLATQNAALNYNNPGLVETAAMQRRDADMSIVKMRMGKLPLDPAVVQDTMTKADAAVVASAVLGRMSSDPVGAKKMLDTWTLPGHLPGDARIPFGVALGELKPRLEEQIDAKAAQFTGDQAGRDAVQRATGGGGGTFRRGVPYTPPNLPPDISPDEDAMVRTVSGEAGREPPDGQRGVAAVIMNRARGAGVSPRDVVFAPNQFEPWNGGAARARMEAMNPASQEYQNILNNVVRPMVAGTAADPTGGATHFYAPVAQNALGRSAPSWASGTPTVIGGHNFYKVGYGPGTEGGTDALPTINNGRAPLTGDQIQGIFDDVDQNPALTTPQSRNMGRLAAEREIAIHDKAVHADQQSFMNDWGTKILKDPTGVTASDILNDPRAQYQQKRDVINELQNVRNGKSEGMGDRFNELFARTNAENDDPNRIQSPAQIYPFLGHGLSFPGVKALEAHITGRNSVDGKTLEMSQQSVIKGAESLINPKVGGKTPSLTGAADYDRFLGAAYRKAAELMKSGKMSPLDIWAEDGPVAKLAESYASPIALQMRDQMQAGSGRAKAGTSPIVTPGAPGVAPVSQAPALNVGAWYRNQGGGLVAVPENTPGARQLLSPEWRSQRAWGPKGSGADQPSAPTGP